MLPHRIKLFYRLINKRSIISNHAPCSRAFNYIECDNQPNKNNIKRCYTNEARVSEASEKLNIDQMITPKDSLQNILNDNDNYIDSLISNIISSIYDRNRVYRNDVLNLLKNFPKKSYISNANVNVMFQCCSKLLVEETPESRMKILDRMIEYLKGRVNYNIENYHRLLSTYYDNKHKVLASHFIQHMHPIKPDSTTYSLLLACVCQHGDMNQASEILSNMKIAKMQLTDKIFNTLIEGYGKAGNIETLEDAVNKMSSSNNVLSPDTEKSILKANIMLKDENRTRDRFSMLLKNPVEFTEHHIIDIISTLAENNQSKFLPECLSLLPEKVKTAPSMSIYMQLLCLELVNIGYYKTAINLYNSLPSNDIGALINTSVFGRILLRECVKVSNCFDDVLYVMEKFINSKRNVLSPYMAYEASMHFGKPEIGIEILKYMKSRKMTIRSHFFWPLFLKSVKYGGEKNVFETVKLMRSLEVKIDQDTIINYVIPYINLLIPEEAIKKMQLNGFTISSCFTSIVIELLKTKRLREASEICETTKTKIDCEVLMQPLLNQFLYSDDIDSVHNMLRAFQFKSRQNNIDWVGNFLVNILTYRKWKVDLKYFQNLVKMLYDSETKISSNAYEFCVNYLNKINSSEVNVASLQNSLNHMVNSDIMSDYNIILSKSNTGSQESMSLEQLELHLIELESTGSNTRGVLRKLLQQYCKLNNIEKALEIYKKCVDEKMPFSNGMKSSIFDIFIKAGNLQKAESQYKDLINMPSRFSLDEFKVIDFATLLIKNGKIERAKSVLKERAGIKNIYGGNNIETNCWNLLMAVAQNKDPLEVTRMLELLRKLGYCKISNILLGPIVRAYLNGNDIEGAVKEMIKCASVYRKMPLKLEILILLVKGSSNSGIEGDSLNLPTEERKVFYQNLLMQVQNAEIQLYGVAKSQLSLMTALTHNKMGNELKKLFLDPNFQINKQDLVKQCERFAFENRIDCLLTLTECATCLKNLNLNEIYEIIIKVYFRNDDYNGALNIWNTMIEREVKPSQSIADILISMLKANDQSIPPSFNSYLKEENRALVF